MSRLSPLNASSYSRPELVKVSNFHIDWTIVFSEKQLKGSILLSVDVIDSSATSLILDTKDLNIESVVNEDNGENLVFTVGENHTCFGASLTIKLPAESSKRYSIKISYSTSECASGLQWLLPKQTLGQSHPYVFSQCQPIHARTLLPCQDTPAVKCPYTATVKTQKDLVAIMSALKVDETETENEKVYRFKQPIPIPSYLIAIAAGNLVKKEISPMTDVWCEAENLEKAAFEFAEIPQMIKHAEKICGEYVWGRYDLLVLPPSFPYGGMENPCLTFVTPTLLAGDRSLADVVVHEICHSWSGNLVTNCQWEDFWLNEGFTMFIERKICGMMHGKNSRDFVAIEGWKDLEDCISGRGASDPLTCLIPNLDGIDPDDAFSSVPYEKGHSLLWALEELLGGPEKFDPFLLAYFQNFRLKSLDSITFRSFLYEFFPDDREALEAFAWDQWWNTPGMPPVKPSFDTTLLNACSTLCKRWLEWNSADECPFKSEELENLTAKQKIVWLNEIQSCLEPFSLIKLRKMDEIYSLTSRKNSEIRYRWLRICIKSKWDEQFGNAIDFINGTGRMKFTRTIYKELYDWPEYRERTVANFLSKKDAMMGVSVHVLSKVLHLTDC